MFLREVIRLHLFDQTYSKNINILILLQFKINVFLLYCKMSFISVIKTVFSASFLQSSVSHDLQKSSNVYFQHFVMNIYLFKE